jgi:predicted RNase H-like nuclease
MPVILGIDAAWSVTQPSGVALIAGETAGLRLLSVASSYTEFSTGPGISRGSEPEAPALLERAAALAGRPVSLVSVDMPLARTPITRRRAADDAVSRAFGAMACGTHTPTPSRPGPLAARIKDGFAAAGYPLATRTATAPALIEVYPHPALVRLTAARYRLPYKIARARAYWPDVGPMERRPRVLDQWRSIIAALERQILDVATTLVLPDGDVPAIALKAFEDRLDAVVCAWVGACVLLGEARPYGDEDAAIWIPNAPDRRAAR